MSVQSSILTAGIDIGSSAVKIAIVESEKGGGRERPGARILARAVERNRRRDSRQVFALAFAAALAEAGIGSKELAYIATTGEGESVEERTGHFYGMTAHARGALYLNPAARAAIDVGALHARAVRFDERGRVLEYRMTSQCASGTGQFLENIARYLGVTLEEVGPLSQTGQNPEKVSGICAVLAETDVINMVSRGISAPNILRGIHDSMATTLAKLLRSAKAVGVVQVTGGLSADIGLLSELALSAGRLGGGAIEVMAHPDGVLAGAIGAALWGAFRSERLAELGAGASIERAAQ